MFLFPPPPHVNGLVILETFPLEAFASLFSVYEENKHEIWKKICFFSGVLQGFPTFPFVSMNHFPPSRIEMQNGVAKLQVGY